MSSYLAAPARATGLGRPAPNRSQRGLTTYRRPRPHTRTVARNCAGFSLTPLTRANSFVCATTPKKPISTNPPLEASDDGFLDGRLFVLMLIWPLSHSGARGGTGRSTGNVAGFWRSYPPQTTIG